MEPGSPSACSWACRCSRSSCAAPFAGDHTIAYIAPFSHMRSLQPQMSCFQTQQFQQSSVLCRSAAAARFLEPEMRTQHEQGQAALQASLFRLISKFGACSNCLAPAKPQEALGFVDLPLHNLSVSNGRLQRIDLSRVSQGCGALFVD